MLFLLNENIQKHSKRVGITERNIFKKTERRVKKV